MEEKMEALHKNNTWQLAPQPQGKKVVGCHWVFIVKHNADGSVNQYKAQLVAQGFTQTYWIDYDKTFAPVANMNTIMFYYHLRLDVIGLFDSSMSRMHSFMLS